MAIEAKAMVMDALTGRQRRFFNRMFPLHTFQLLSLFGNHLLLRREFLIRYCFSLPLSSFERTYFCIPIST